jgi:5'-nucleotidase
MTLRVLVTNDDGIGSPGLHALARAVAAAGATVLVAAPHAECSGVGAGLVSHRDGGGRVTVTPYDLPGTEAYAVHAYPAMAVLIGCGGGFGPPPDLVLSGVNRGGNVSRAVLHSGTVAAALTAGVGGVTALAVSLDVVDAAEAPEWAAATTAAVRLLPWLGTLPAGRVLSLNVPNRPGDPGEPVWAPLAGAGNRRTAVAAPLRDGGVDVRSLPVPGGPEPGSDAALLAAGRAVLTPLRSVSTDERLVGTPIGGVGG